MKKYTGIILLIALSILIAAFNTGCNSGYKNEEDLSGFTELDKVETDNGFEELMSEEEAVSSYEPKLEEEVEEESMLLIEEESQEETEEEVEEATEEEEEVVAPIKVNTPESKATATGKKIIVVEGELISLKLKGTDPDGDEITYTYSLPLNGNGEWKTEVGDAGSYEVEITASDGKAEVSKTLAIEVLKANEPPVLEGITDITVEEGETVRLSPVVSDPDGDKVSYTISGWMTSLQKETGYNDAGTYTVTVTATDGEFLVSSDATITVIDVNRAPEFEIVME